MDRSGGEQCPERARKRNELANHAIDRNLKARLHKLAAKWVEIAIKREKSERVAAD